MDIVKDQRVFWKTAQVMATVIKETEFGDIVIWPDDSKLPVTTRKCYLDTTPETC